MKPDADLEQQREYYTKRWSSFAFANSFDLARMAAVFEELSEIGFESPPAICDLGCGAGWSTSMLGAFGPVVGVDLSDTTIAAERFPHCRFESANILEWEGPPELVDVVVSLEVIEHIERPLQEKFVEVAHRLLKPGGHLILTTPNARTMRAMAQRGVEWSNQPIEEWLTAGELRRLCAARFDVLDVRSIIMGMGVRGSYRLANSAKLRQTAQSLGGGPWWDLARSRAMYGLHLLAHCRKPLQK